MFARPGLPRFDYVQASTADEAVTLLQDYGPDARLLMGGTDLFPGLREGRFGARVLIDVKQLPGMRQLDHDDETGLTIGAAVTMNELARHPVVQARYPVLAQAAGTVASYQIRNRATIGGNLCNASPCADTAPATLVLEAEFLLYGLQGERAVTAGEFFRGPGQTALRPAEMMVGIRIPASPSRAAARYLKLGRCRSGDLSLVGVAVCGFGNGDGRHAFRIALGSVAPTPVRASEAEAHLASQPAGEAAFAGAAEKAMAASSPISDVRGTAEYQRAMVRTLTLRALRDVWAQLLA
ncbi:MAG: xanthine dehydrogenase family protein subunit M [Anaerolineae bacterium]|nr:xanthine dehydrogenase family protein subunit M [Anaerolineae bacterium]